MEVTSLFFSFSLLFSSFFCISILVYLIWRCLAVQGERETAREVDEKGGRKGRCPMHAPIAPLSTCSEELHSIDLPIRRERGGVSIHLSAFYTCLSTSLSVHLSLSLYIYFYIRMFCLLQHLFVPFDYCYIDLSKHRRTMEYAFGKWSLYLIDLYHNVAEVRFPISFSAKKKEEKVDYFRLSRGRWWRKDENDEKNRFLSFLPWCGEGSSESTVMNRFM